MPEIHVLVPNAKQPEKCSLRYTGFLVFCVEQNGPKMVIPDDLEKSREKWSALTDEERLGYSRTAERYNVMNEFTYS